ncbi:MAG: phage tail tape measure protein [Clostridiales bacterium]|jgi:TP901 family phage tail tape measure protein|nr:phage tail tape measure protein [Clostridiales bacterium]
MHDILLSPIVSTVVSDNKKLLKTIEALNKKYTLILDVDIDKDKLNEITKNLQATVSKANATASIKFDDFKSADVSLRKISQVTAEKLKQFKVNQQLLANEKQRSAVEEANSKISIAHSRAKIQSDREEISQSRLKIQLENERIKLLQIAEREAKTNPTDMQTSLVGKMDNTAKGSLSVGDANSLGNLRSQLMAVDLASSNAKTKIKEFEQQYKQLLSEIKKGNLIDNSFGINSGSTDDQFKTYIANLKQIEEAQVKIANSSNITFGQDGSPIRVINALVEDGAGHWQKYQYSVNDATGQVRELNKGLQENSVSIKHSFDNIKRLVGQYVSLYTAIRLVRQAFTEMKAVDTEMVSIQKVTGRTKEEMDKLAQAAYGVGSAYGRGASEFLASVAKMAQGGYGNTAEELGELAVLTQNVGDVTAETANKFLITADAAWKLGGNTKELMKILDGMNEVSNRNATEVQKLAEGVEVAGAVFAQAGLSARDYTALIGAGTAATGETGNEFARAFRTIVMNLNQIKGTTDDGEIIDEASFGKAGKAVEGLGVKMTYLDGNIHKLRDTMDIFKDLAPVWEKLDEAGRNIKQSELAEALGGKRQANALIAILDNWDKVIKMQNEYANSAGSALRENEIYMGSWEAKSKQLANTWTEFVAKTIDSDWIKGGLGAVTWLIESFDNLGTVIALAGTWFAALKFKDIVSGFSKIGSSVNAAGGKFKGFIQVLIQHNQAAALAKAQNISLSEAYKQLGFSVAATQLIINGLMVALTAGIMMWNNYKQKQEENRRAAEEYAKAQTETTNTLQEQIKIYDELNKKKLETEGIEDIKGINEEILSLQEQIKKSIGEQADSVDIVNGKYEEQYQKLTEILVARKKANIEDLRSASILANDKLSEGENTGYFTSDPFGSISNQIRENTNDFVPINIEEIFTTPIDIQVSSLKRWQKDLNAAAESGKDVTDALSWVQARLKWITDAQNEATTATQNYNNALAEISLYEDFGLQAVKSKEDLDKFVQTVNDSENIKIGDLGLKESRQLLIELAQKNFPEFINSVNSTPEKINSFSVSLTNLSEKIRLLKAAEEEQKNSGGISTDTYGAFIAQGEDFEKLVSSENGKIVLLTAKMKEYSDSLVLAEIKTAILNKADEEYIKTLMKLFSVESDVLKVFRETEKATELASSAEKQMQDDKKISIDTYDQLKESGIDLTGVIKEENGAILFNSEAFINNAVAKLEADLAAKELERSKLADTLREQALMAYGSATSMAIYGTAVEETRKALAGMDTEIFDLTQSLLAFKNWTPPEPSRSSGSGSDTYKEAADKEFKTLEEIRKRGEISEREYLTRMSELNDRYFKGKDKYLDEAMSNETEYITGMRELREQEFDAQIKELQDAENYDGLKQLLAEEQINIQSEINRLKGIGFQDTDIEIKELEQKWRDYGEDIKDVNEDIVNSLNYQFEKSQSKFDRDIRKIGNAGLGVEEDDYASREKLINDELAIRIDRSEKLISEMETLRNSTDDNIKSTDSYISSMDNLEQSYENNVKSIYDLVNAQKSIAEEQISEVKDMQDKIVDMLQAQYEKEEELLKNKYDAQKKAIEAEKDLIKSRYDSEIDLIDESLKSMKKVWDAEDARKRRQDYSDDISELEKRKNELSIAAGSGDAWAISEIENINEQIKDKQKEIAEFEVQEQRKAVEASYSDQKDNLAKQYDTDISALEERQKLLDAEYEKDSALIQEKLKNANIYAEARLKIEKGITDEMITDLQRYEDEFGEGMGILGDYIKDKLAIQIESANESLAKLPEAIKTANTETAELISQYEALSNIINNIFSSENMADISKLGSSIDYSTSLDSVNNKPQVKGLSDNWVPYVPPAGLLAFNKELMNSNMPNMISEITKPQFLTDHENFIAEQVHALTELSINAAPIELTLNNNIDHVTTEAMPEIKRYVAQALNRFGAALKEEIAGDLFRRSPKRRI